MKLDGDTAIVMLQTGGPDRLEGIEDFLLSVFSDPSLFRVPFLLKPLRSRFVARAVRDRLPAAVGSYERIGGFSPIHHITGAQVGGVATRIGSEGYVAMRHASPRAAETIRLILHEGMKRAVVISGHPQPAECTNGSAVRDFRAAWADAGLADQDLLLIERWFDHPGYLDALAATVYEACAVVPADEDCHVLFTAHGIPVAHLTPSETYPADLARTLEAVVARIEGMPPHTLAYQGRLGSLEWTGPQAEDVIDQLGRDGIENLVLVPIGFVSDHLETMYELDMVLAGRARGLGMRIYRAATLNDRPDFLDALADLVRERAVEEVAA